MSDISKAPWTLRQVSNLEYRQATLLLHPYTCTKHTLVPLRPTHDGWVCDVVFCNYTQDWAQAKDTEYTKWWEENA